MDNQLVVQFEASTSDDFARLILFEETLNEGLANPRLWMVTISAQAN
jgi:hypothetical protein